MDELPRPSAEGLGTVEEFPEGLLKYSQFLVQTINGDLSGLTICVDAANGQLQQVLIVCLPILKQIFIQWAQIQTG